MKTVSKQQKRIIQSIDENVELSHWRNWRWQMQHCIRDLDTFEGLLCVQLDPHMREGFTRTVKKFPMSITPYYLSLIDANDMANDPVFRQAFPSPMELVVVRSDMADHDKTISLVPEGNLRHERRGE